MSAVERFLVATDRAVRSGVRVPCLGSYTTACTPNGWLPEGGWGKNAVDRYSGRRGRGDAHLEINGWLSDDPQERAEAALACRSCPVIVECLAFAQAHRTTHGVYGGRDFTVVFGKRADG